jgi:hypothetical protein
MPLPGAIKWVVFSCVIHAEVSGAGLVLVEGQDRPAPFLTFSLLGNYPLPGNPKWGCLYTCVYVPEYKGFFLKIKFAASFTR